MATAICQSTPSNILIHVVNRRRMVLISRIPDYGLRRIHTLVASWYYNSRMVGHAVSPSSTKWQWIPVYMRIFNEFVDRRIASSHFQGTLVTWTLPHRISTYGACWKEKCIVTSHKCLMQLKYNNRQEIARCVAALKRLFRACFEANGGHFKYSLWCLRAAKKYMSYIWFN